jgi:hypothetical protein
MVVSKVHIRSNERAIAKAIDKFFARARATTTHQIDTGKSWARTPYIIVE